MFWTWVVIISKGKKQRIELRFSSEYNRMLFLDALNRTMDPIQIGLYTTVSEENSQNQRPSGQG